MTAFQTIFRNSRFLNLVSAAVKGANRIPPYLFVLFLFVLYFFKFGVLHNEEHYMSLAKYFFSPEWIANSFTLDQPIGTRFIYQYTVGFLLQYFSFEWVKAAGVLLLCFGISLPLARLYKLFHFSNIEIVLHLPLLYFAVDSFFGGEYLFLSFEPKSFGYVFVLFSVYFMIREKYWSCIAFAIVGTYFHVLVAGWFTFYFGIYHIFLHRSVKKSALIGLTYLLGVIPFLVISSSAVSGTLTNTSNGVLTLNQINAFYKLPHHIGLWKSIPYFISQHFAGVLLTACFVLICYLLFSKYENKLNQKLTLFNLVIGIGPLVWVAIGYFDKEGSLIKYFPYRINALFAFLFFLQLVFVLKGYFIIPQKYLLIQVGVLMFFLLTSLPLNLKRMLINDNIPFFQGQLDEQQFVQATDYIRRHSSPDDVLLYLPFGVTLKGGLFPMDGGKSITLIRKTERDRFVSVKMSPINPVTDKIFEWLDRVREKEKILMNPDHICQTMEDYRIDMILSEYPLRSMQPCWTEEFKNEKYYLYRTQP